MLHWIFELQNIVQREACNGGKQQPLARLVDRIMRGTEVDACI